MHTLFCLVQIKIIHSLTSLCVLICFLNAGWIYTCVLVYVCFWCVFCTVFTDLV